MSRHPESVPVVTRPRVLLAPGEVVDRMHAARERARRAAVEELELAVEWALLHPCPRGEEPAAWSEPQLYAQRIVPLAGPGAPLVAEFAPADLAAALGISFDAGRQLVADALELAYRMPRLWDLVRQDVVPAYVARMVSRETHDLSHEAALYADRLVCAVPDKIGPIRSRTLVDEARLWHDPDRALDDEQQALADRHVRLARPTSPGSRDLQLRLDREDAERLDHTIAELAAKLSDRGDPDPLDLRRARAAGILADPQRALDLLEGDPGPGPGPGSGEGIVIASAGRPAGWAHLFVHRTPEDLAEHLEAGTGAGTVEKIGAASLELIETWLEGRSFVVRPVLDVTRTEALAPVDAHDPPAAMREAVIQRDATCVFPGCRRDSRTCDLDHIDPWIPPHDSGPPGQTRLDNLAPLCRTHHRIKTFTAWDYQRRPDASHLWTSPTGHTYPVPPSPRHIAR